MAEKKRRKKGKPGGSPGVFVDEVSSGARPIEGVGTAVAAFVGLVPRPLRAAAVVVVVAMAVAAVRGRRLQ